MVVVVVVVVVAVVALLGGGMFFARVKQNARIMQVPFCKLV